MTLIPKPVNGCKEVIVIRLATIIDIHTTNDSCKVLEVARLTMQLLLIGLGVTSIRLKRFNTSSSALVSFWRTSAPNMRHGADARRFDNLRGHQVDIIMEQYNRGICQVSSQRACGQRINCNMRTERNCNYPSENVLRYTVRKVDAFEK